MDKMDLFIILFVGSIAALACVLLIVKSILIDINERLFDIRDQNSIFYSSACRSLRLMHFNALLKLKDYYANLGNYEEALKIKIMLDKDFGDLFH